MLVTENFDNLHRVAAKSLHEGDDEVEIKEIHGNAYYMHCSDETQEHSHRLVKAPCISENLTEVPQCSECNAPMKPHCLFFDEVYSEHFYSKDTVLRYVEMSDCLIIVGTSL